MMRYAQTEVNLDHIMLALADQTRRRILIRVAAGDARVTDIAAAFPISLNSVSKHIRLLERARLLERRVKGREHFLHFRPEPLNAAQDWIATQQRFWTNRLEALDAILMAEDAAKIPNKEP